ncbi:MAG: PfaD family polyunsaturated fatty acid/polyketide biosynthesis protein [Desulfobacterales bacterium]
MQTPNFALRPIGWWNPANQPPETGDEALRAAIRRVGTPVCVIAVDGRPAVGRGGRITLGCGRAETGGPPDGYPVLGYVPALHPADFGDPYFKHSLRLRYPYVIGAMANGITSVNMVETAARAGMIGFFGAAGLSLAAIEAAIVTLRRNLADLPFGFNLIHSPNEPGLEAATVDLYLKHAIGHISASAYLDLTLPLVYYRVKGIHRDRDGRIVCPRHVTAKISRIEVARKFFSPPPEKILRQLLDRHMITAAEAELARSIPVADTMTAEADSGGHTDNQPAISLLPTILALKDQMAESFGYDRPLCVGLGGGIATPAAVAAAFALGAAFVLTGSVNQACIEAGTSAAVRSMLADACQADVAMAPAADMFEMNVKVQVLKRGTLFPFRAAKLYDIYGRCDSLADIPPKEKLVLERDFFRRSLDEEWEQTLAFFRLRDPRQIERAERDPKHKMALVFRSYLGQSSNWANSGDPARKVDYQIWCGPAMGAFNEWTRGSFLAAPENRTVVTVAHNLLLGAAVAMRFNWLTAQGLVLPPASGLFRPLPPQDLAPLLDRDSAPFV